MNLEVIAHLIYPPVISLMSSKEKLKCRKMPLVLLFFTPINNREYEDCAHHLLLLFRNPFRNEADLKVGVPPSHINKIVEPDKINIKRNRAMLNHFVKLLIKHYYTTINQH